MELEKTQNSKRNPGQQEQSRRHYNPNLWYKAIVTKTNMWINGTKQKIGEKTQA